MELELELSSFRHFIIISFLHWRYAGLVRFSEKMTQTKHTVVSYSDVGQDTRLISLFCNHSDYLQLLLEMLGFKALVKLDTAVSDGLLRMQLCHGWKNLVLNHWVDTSSQMIWCLRKGIRVSSVRMDSYTFPYAILLFTYKLRSLHIWAEDMCKMDLYRSLRPVFRLHSYLRRLILEDVVLDAQWRELDTICETNVLDVAMFKGGSIPLPLCAVLDTRNLIVIGLPLNIRDENEFLSRLKRLKSLQTLTLGGMTRRPISKNFTTKIKKTYEHISLDAGFGDCILCKKPNGFLCRQTNGYMHHDLGCENRKVLDLNAFCLITGDCSHRLCVFCDKRSPPRLEEMQRACSGCDLVRCISCIENGLVPMFMSCHYCKQPFCNDCCQDDILRHCQICNIDACGDCGHHYICTNIYCSHFNMCTASCNDGSCQCQCGYSFSSCELIKTVCSCCTKTTSCWDCEEVESVEDEKKILYDTKCPYCDQIMCYDCLENTTCCAGYYHIPSTGVPTK